MARKGVLLVNLGTPDSPTWNGLRTYLNQFLTDRRVIDLPWLFRNMLFKGIVVPIRSRRVSKLYQRLWLKEGSPLKVYGQNVAKGVQEKLGAARAELAEAGNEDPQAALDKLTETERQVHAASIDGDRKTLVADAAIPATMAVIYLLLLFYFKAVGGYKPVEIDSNTGGSEA